MIDGKSSPQTRKPGGALVSLPAQHLEALPQPEALAVDQR